MASVCLLNSWLPFDAILVGSSVDVVDDIPVNAVVVVVVADVVDHKCAEWPSDHFWTRRGCRPRRRPKFLFFLKASRHDGTVKKSLGSNFNRKFKLRQTVYRLQ